jgi:Icc-related predicted phosphoesterase
MKYLDDPISAAYVSDMEDFIVKHQPSYWIHGHIHTPVNYKIGNTEIICNPHGYINEPYNGFNKNLVIEI